MFRDAFGKVEKKVPHDESPLMNHITINKLCTKTVTVRRKQETCFIDPGLCVCLKSNIIA